MVGIKDVAREAGVSVGTVSNVLNRPDSVSPAKRALVEAAVVRLGYVRNESARQLRAGSSRTIALVVLDVANPFFADVIAGAEEAAEDVGALVVVSNSAGNPDREARHLARLEAQRVMGVLLSPVREGENPAVAELERRGTPVVLVDRVSESAAAPSVAVDDVRGGRLAGEHLLSLGHRRIAFVGGPDHLGQVRDRLAGLRTAAGGAGAQGGAAAVEVVPSDDMSVRAGSAAAARLFAQWPDPADRPTAVFCANDLLALGVLNECVRRGVRVPHELALVGYDDIGYAGTAAVPLTSVRQPRELLGRTAVELLLEAVEGAAGEDARGEGRHVQFVPELVVRESTRSSR
ncbi:LacI family transcriptional regulator [Streptomyces sp. NP160]|uniref:LacI family DNA-binding transcriptional regulator n=1 Tax=Streptomyces sp. NP160 TaxID=2586637 RepID=UPI00111A3977|nr:LacI family transcriptional regulator [Streptomyces sp. NP160]